MSWIRNDVQDCSSFLNNGISENRTLVSNHYLLPMAVMRRCLDTLGLSRHSAAGLASSPGRGRLQPLTWKTSFGANLDESTKRGTHSKRKISKEELKKSISVPYGPLYLVEVGPVECEEDVEGSDLKRPRILRPPACRASAIRPQKFKPGKNSYIPVESTLTQPVSKRELVARIYRNTVLACRDIYSLKQLEASASQTLARLDHRIKELHHLESAVLAVYLLRHRVVIFEASKPFQCRANAFAAYGAYTAGKFCYPDGDLLILPGFHSNLAVSRSLLSELQVAMHTIHNLGGPYSPRIVRIQDPKTITPAVRKRNRVGKEFPVEGVEHIDLFFKPLFTKCHYHMNNDKARLTVEVLQATIIVLINLTEEALWNEDFGAALFLAQNIRRCANCLLWILMDDDLKNSYLFTMMEWYWARSYYSVSSHWSKHRDHMMTRYNTTKKELEGFTNSCYGGIVLYAFLVHVDCSTSNPRQEFSFPQTACESTRLCVEGYNKIEVPPSWRRSTYERVSSVSLNLHYKIMGWADSVDRRVNGESFAHNIEVVQDCNTEIDNVLQQLSEEDLPYLRVLLYNLSAKCCRILAAYDDANALRSRLGRPCLVGWKAYSETFLDKRSLRQWAALKLMIKVYQSDPSDLPRRMLLKMARQTFFDEVIYEVQKQVTDPTRTDGLSTITRLLPYVLYVWFGADVPILPGGLEDRIPKEEKPIFEQIIAMMFMGSALIHCLMFRRAVNEPEKNRFLNNAIYYHVLAWPYLQRPTVTSAVVNAFYKSLELAEASTIEYHKNSLQNGASRCCAILLGYVVTLLPMLWEMCISHKDDFGPNEGERNFVIGEIKYPVDVKAIRFETTTDKVDLKIYESITTFLNFDFGLTSSREGRCVVLRGDIGSKEEPGYIKFIALCHKSLVHNELHDVPESRSMEIWPLLTGTCGCSGRKKGCPIENYHYVDEQRFVTEDKFDDALYDEVFSNLSLTNGNSGDDSLDHLFLNLKKTIENVLAKAISELQVLKDKKDVEIMIETNAKNPMSALRLDRLLKDLAHTSSYLKFPDPPVLVITRVLSSLDQIFHNKQTHAMLRGSF